MASQPQLFLLANDALVSTVSRIPDDKWNAEVPEWLSASDKEKTLHDVVASHAYDLAWVSDTLAGKTLDEVGDAHDGDLLGAEPAVAFAAIGTKAADAARSLSAADVGRTTHLSYGDFPAGEYLTHTSTYHGFRAYTIAAFAGVDTSLPPALVDALWDEVVPQADAWRQMGVFGPEIAVPDDADKQTKLLAITGFLVPAPRV